MIIPEQELEVKMESSAGTVRNYLINFGEKRYKI